MNITKDDLAILEQALQSALANSTDYQEISMYEQVLEKFHQQHKARADGFRYDYDDSNI
ncbi:hypothetical protein [Sutcliffiella deserti]|uniref:hypothetical protein n=1 Tax=Sutcliffiella deserti TaxID=2875501 RepID=UPI001CBBBF4C|nr:hypothetical protein [Sutcliffiella deserti]